jgi:hypothetical protein
LVFLIIKTNKRGYFAPPEDNGSIGPKDQHVDGTDCKVENGEHTWIEGRWNIVLRSDAEHKEKEHIGEDTQEGDA